MGSLIFVSLVIVLVSGLIAYVGDLVGRKMGRKRLTLMGLRPRHTAIVISVAVGMLIALLTLVSLLAINRSIREAFFSLDQVRAGLRAARGELVQARAQTAEARQQLETQAAEIARTQGLLADARAQLAARRGDLQAKRRELARAETSLRDTRGNLARAKREVGAYSRRILTMHDLLGKKYAPNVLAWQYIASKMVFSPLAMTCGQEILSGLAPTGAGGHDRRAWLEAFFAMAERIVRRQCPNLPREMPALVFIAGERTSLDRIPSREAIDRLLRRLDRVDGADGVVMHVTAVNNVPTDGFAFIAIDSIRLVPNHLAYRAGDPVARVVVTVGEQTRTADLLASLADELLRRQLPEALRRKDMIPIARRFDPASTARIPDPTMPAVSWDELMAAVDKIRSMRGKITLVARAHADVRYYGPLNVDIDTASAP